VGVRLTDWLSLGAGPAITYGNLDWTFTLAPGGGPGAKVKLDDLDDWAVAAYVGLLLEPHEDLRVGFIYQSKTDFHLKGDTKGPLGGALQTDVDLPLAQSWRIDVRWQATDALAFSLGGAYEEWGALDRTAVDLGDISSQVRLGFKDTWKLRGGVHYQINEQWLAQTGISYDSSALRNRSRTVALPIDEQWRFGVGGSYRWTEDRTVAFAFEYLNLGKGKVNDSVIRGEYDDNHIFFFMVNLNFAKLPWDGMASF
jgi:long-chain fatty acid transport protein